MRPGMVIGEQLEDGVKESVVEGRGVNESGRARLYVNRSGPVMQEENIGLGPGLVVGFFSEKSLGLRKIL